MPLLEEFDGPKTFKLAAYENGPIEATKYAQYMGAIDFLSDTPRVASVPGPIVGAGLPGLLLAGLGVLGWRPACQGYPSIELMDAAENLLPRSLR